MNSRSIVIAITGASGALYGVRLVEELLRANVEVDVVLSRAAAKVIQIELGRSVNPDEPSSTDLLGEDPPSGVIRVHGANDLLSPIASGSHQSAGMVIVPCSMGTLGRIAGGISGSLIERAADVCLKERRRLILVPRETPLNEVHCRNMLDVTRAGAIVLPASPGFYHQPDTIDDLAAFIVTKILDLLDVPSDLIQRWGAGTPQAES